MKRVRGRRPHRGEVKGKVGGSMSRRKESESRSGRTIALPELVEASLALWTGGSELNRIRKSRTLGPPKKDLHFITKKKEQKGAPDSVGRK